MNHDWKGLEFDHYPEHQKITLKWAQVEKYIDLMIQSDRYLTDEEKEQRTTVQEENGYKVGDDVMVDLPTGTIEGTIGYIGETDVRIDTSTHGQSWDNEVINKRQFEDGLRQNEPSQRVDEMLEQAETIYKESEVPEYERFFVREVVGGTSQLFAVWDDLNEGYYANDNGMAQFTDKEQAESYCTALKKETDERMQGLHKTVFAKAPAMGKIWRDFGHAFSFASSSSRGIYPSPSYLIWMCCTRFPLDLSGAST